MDKNTFDKINIGDTFRFASEWNFPFSGMKRGLAKKISKRKYIYPKDEGIYDGLEYQVGTTKAEIVKTDK